MDLDVKRKHLHGAWHGGYDRKHRWTRENEKPV